jgi:putative copper resistance protein D
MRAIPARRDGSRGVREWVLAIVHSRYASFFSHPIVAAINFAGSLIVFYYSGIMYPAMDTHIGHELMIVHFLLAGYFFAQSIIGVDPGIKQYPYPVRLIVLLATMAFHAFFGISIMSATALIAGDWFGNMGHGWVSALDDQVTGGEIAWGIGEFPTLGLAIIMAVEWYQSSKREATRSDRAEERTGDAELAAYNAMLAGLAARDEETDGRAQ